jgi:hypothetical protein
MSVTEVAGVEHLNSGIVVAIEWGDGAGASGR